MGRFLEVQPGNVRELANAIERAIIMATREEIQVEDLAVDIQTMAPEPTADLAGAHAAEPDPSWLDRPWSQVRTQVLEEAELRYLRGLLEATHGRIGETASPTHSSRPCFVCSGRWSPQPARREDR
jgi:DNA-binding NtrC family response regulator